MARFASLAATRGLRLDLRSSLLYRKQKFYMNGEYVEVAPQHTAALRRLADERGLPPGFPADEILLMLLHEWLRAGYLVIG
jgi:50S ribosomal protein L16 3-hydroxylase